MARTSHEGSFGFWILSAANRLERTANEVLKKHGIIYRQVQVLGAISMHEELSQAELVAQNLFTITNPLLQIDCNYTLSS